MANWRDSAKEIMKRREADKVTPVTVTPPEIITKTAEKLNSDGWQAQAKEILKRRNYIEPEKRKYEIKLSEDEPVRTISYDAKQAIENNSTDKYMPKNEEEKAAMTEYENWASEQVINIPVSNSKSISLKYGTAKSIDDYVDSLSGKNRDEKAKMLDGYIKTLNLSPEEQKQANSYAGLKKLAFASASDGKDSFEKEATQWGAKGLKGMYDIAEKAARMVKSGFNGLLDGGEYNNARKGAIQYYEDNPDMLGHHLFLLEQADKNGVKVALPYGAAGEDYLRQIKLDKFFERYKDTNAVTQFIGDAGFYSAGQMLGAMGLAGMGGADKIATAITPITTVAGNAIKATKIGKAANKIISATPAIKNVAGGGAAGKLANAAINKLNNVSVKSAVKFLNPLDNPTTAVMGVGAAQDKYDQLIKMGYDEDSAKANALFTGYVSSITEKMGYDGTPQSFYKYGGKILSGGSTASKAKNVGNALKAYLSANVSEGLEEVYNLAFERVGDYFTGIGYVDENGKLQKRRFLGKEGIIDPVAMGESFLGGFVGGTVMGGANFISEVFNNDADTVRRMSADIKKAIDENNQAVVNIAKQVGVEDASMPEAPDFKTATVEEMSDFYEDTIEASKKILSDERVIKHDEEVIANATNAFKSELEEIASSGAVELYAPENASESVKLLEKELIRSGIADEQRKTIIKSAINTESRSKAPYVATETDNVSAAVHENAVNVSVGDTFRDTKTGNIITVVERDSENTTVRIDTGSKTETKEFSNTQADSLVTNQQFERLEASGALSSEEAQKYNIIVSNLKRKAEELGLLDKAFYGALQDVNMYNPTESNRALIGSEFQRVFAGNTDPLVTGWLNAIGVDTQSVTSINPENVVVTDENTPDSDTVTDTDVINHTEEIEGLKLIDIEESTLVNGKTLITGVYELNTDRDFSRKSYKKERFDIFCNSEPWIKTVDGTTYGHYGFAKSGSGGYAVTYLPVGLAVTKANTEKDAKLMLKTLEENRPELPLSIKAFGDGYRCLGISRELVTDIKEVIETAVNSDKTTNMEILEGKVPFNTKAGLIEYVKAHKGDNVRVMFDNGISEVRTLEGVSNTNLRTKKPDGSISNAELKGLKFNDEGFSVDYSTGVSASYDFVNVGETDDNATKSDESVTESAESVIKKAESVIETPDNEKITIDMDDGTRAELLKKKSVNVVGFNAENAKALDNIDLDALQNSYPSYARPIIKKIARDFGIVNEPFFNPDIELEFSYSGDSIQESINKQHSRYGDFVKMLSVFSDVIENAVGVETHKDKYTGTRREDTNLKQMYVLASAFSDEKGIYPVKLEVKEFKKNTNKLYLSVVLTKKESRYLSGNLGQDQLNTAPPTSTISISDLVSIVNPSEGDFLKYFPDSMLDNEQIESKNKALAKEAEKIEKLKESLKSENETPRDDKNYASSLTDRCELIKTKHTTTGNDIWVVALKDRLSPDEYKDLSGKVKAVGGYYSRYAKTPDGKAIPGFVFKSEPTVKEIKVFNDFFDYAEETTPADTQTADVNEKVYELVKKARNTEPVDTKSLEEIRDTYGNDLYTEALDKVLTEMQADELITKAKELKALMAEEKEPDEVLKNKDKSDTISQRKEGEDFKVGDILEFGGERWKCVGIDDVMIDFENVDKKALHQELSVLLPYDLFKQKTDYSIVKETTENAESQSEVLDRESEPDGGRLRTGASGADVKTGVEEANEPHRNRSGKGLSESIGTDRSRPDVGNDSERVYGTDDANNTESESTGNSAEITDPEPETIDTEVKTLEKKRPSNKGNFVITNDIAAEFDSTAPSAKDNIEAIELLIKLENEGRPATAEEKKILAKYKGWGGIDTRYIPYELSSRFGQLFDWEQRKAMQSSQNNAFFTPTGVIDAMYNGLKRMGFKGGNVLETSMGIGNFFGRMPSAISAKSALTGVELESYTARIAQYLYPGATVINMPYQDVAIKNGSYDLVIGNVPFGQNKISYNKKKYALHNYFIISSLDKVRDGGIVAVITSAGTLESHSLDARAAIMDRADVVACYKLPEKVFSRNASTDVQTDLLILRKRAAGTKPSGDSILNTTTTADGLHINEYFVKHPENVLGTLAKGHNAWGEITTVLDNGDFYDRLNAAMKKLPKDLISGKIDLKPVETIVSVSDKPRFFEKNGKVYADDGAGVATEISKNQANTVRDYMAVRDAYKELLDAYENGETVIVEDGTASIREHTEDDFKLLRDNLSKAYDNFYKKHGAITGDGKKKIGTKKSTNNTFLEADADYYLVSGLERYDAKNSTFAKSALFEKDTLRKKRVTSVDAASDALAVSLNESGKIDFARIQELTGKTEKQLAEELKGEIVLTPDGEYVLTDIYLSGNIYEKLDAVKGKPEFKDQQEMLEKVIPTPKDASDITVKLGANYIDAKHIEQFAREILNSHLTIRKDVSGRWVIEGVKQSRYGDVVNIKYGCNAFNAVQLLEKILNDGEITATKKVGTGRDLATVFDPEMTDIARQKADDIRAAFETWIFASTDRRTEIVDNYNRTYNNYRPLDYEHIAEKLSFDSMDDVLKSKLYPHQKKGIARFLFGGNILFAHGVGTGKTFEMIASVMEAKRMGIINKAAMVVPNNKVVDFKNDIAQAYPNAKVLVIDTANKKRQTMLGLVNSNDWDIVLIARTTFTRIPVSRELQAHFVSQQLEDLELQIAEAEYDRSVSKRQLKGMITQRDNFEQKLKDLSSDTKRDDDGIEFEKLGIDCICVDEAHNYKSIMTPTKLDIKGLVNRNNAQMANDMLMKLDYLRSIDGKIIFGTGTPITNTVSEIYNMMRMVRPDILEDAGIHSLDEWVNTFAKIETTTEIGIDNQIKNKSTQVIRSFINVSEMIGMFRQFADIVFTEDVVKNLPKAVYKDVELDGTEEHRQIEQQISSVISTAKKADLLKVYGQLMSMADVASVDLRMLAGAESEYNPFKDYSLDELEYADSKINTMCDNVYEEYKASEKIKGTQIIFCDKGSGSGTVYSFNLHKDIMQKLIERGIPQDQIVIIKNQSDAQLEALYEKVNAGEVRVLIGTSQKMAEGLNVQKRVVAIHHPTVTYKPSDKEQGDARGVRAGNINDEVHIYRYLQKNTFDSHKWQAQDRKGEMINKALRGEVVSEMEDIGADEDSGAGVDAATAMAITSGNPLVKEKIDIDKEVVRLKTLQRNYLSEMYRYQDAISKNPAKISQLTRYADNIEQDIALRNKYGEKAAIVIKGKTFEKQTDANKALVDAVKSAPKNGQYVKLGTYNGFDIMFKGDTGGMNYSLILKGSNEYRVEYAGNGNNIARFAGVLNRLDAELKRVRETVETLKADLDFAKKEVTKPFEKEKELSEALEKQKDITYRYEHFSEKTASAETEETVQSSKDLKSSAYRTERRETDEVYTGGNILEDGDELDGSKTEIETREILQRRDSGDFSGRGIPQIDGGRYRTVEKRSIQEVVETDKFSRLSHFVVSEISYSLNKKVYEKYKTDKRWDDGYEFPEMITYDMLADKDNELRGLFADNIAEYFNDKIDASADITGALVPVNVISGTKESVVKNENGQLIPVYHGTAEVFDTFKSSDVGIHFGSYAQAVQRVNDKGIKKPRFIKAYLNIENPLYIDGDFFGWNAFQIAQHLSKMGIISNEEALSYFESSKKSIEDSNKTLVNMLRNKEFDGIVYNNEYESISGKSYIVFGNEQIFKIDEGANSVYSSKDIADDESRWTTERVEGNEGKGVNLADIVRSISKKFDIPIATGKVTDSEASGIYKRKAETIRTRIANNLPTISHELGHHLDKGYNFSTMESVELLKSSLPAEFLEQYEEADRGREAVAEFVRVYLKNTNDANRLCPEFYADFISTLSKEDLKTLNEIAASVNEYLSYNISERYDAAITTSKKQEKLSFKEKWQRIYTSWVDAFHPQKEAVDFVEEVTGHTLSGKGNAYVLATNSLNAHTIANYLICEGFRDLDGNIVDAKSFVESIGMVDSKNVALLDKYLVLRHSLEWIKPTESDVAPKRVFADDTLENVEEIKKQISKIEAEHPEIKTAAENLYEYQNNVIRHFVIPAGGMSEDTLNMLNRKYPSYVPFYRAVGNKKSGVAKGTFVNQRSPIMRAEGSGELILSPTESIIRNTEKMVKLALRNQTARVLSSYADTVDGFGQFMEAIPPDMIPHSVNISKSKESFTDALQQVVSSGKDYSAVSDLFEQIFGDEVTDFTPVANANKRIITVLQDGKPTYYQIHDEALYNAIAELAPQQANGYIKWATKIMQPMKLLITQNNPIFAMTNAIRDFGTAYKLSEENNLAVFAAQYIKALGGIVTNNSDYKRYKAMGGGHSSELSANVDNIARTLRAVAHKDMGKARRLAYSIFVHPIETVAMFNDAIESVPRFAEFQRTLKDGGDLQEAIFNASDITTNFKRSGGGVGVKIANSTFMFNNAAIQGIDKTFRTLTNKDTKKRYRTLLKWLLHALLMGIIGYIYNKEVDEEGYKNLSSYKKNNFYNFAIGDGKFISLPKPRENALLDTFTERVIEYAFGNENAFYDFSTYLGGQLIPPMIPDDLKSIEDTAHSWLSGTVLGGVVDIGFNQDFKDTPIESVYDIYTPSHERHTESTTKLAYALGQTRLARASDLSPKKIDHLISSYTGILGQINKALFPMNGSRRDISFGLRNKFISDSNYSTDVLNRMYENQEKAEKAFQYSGSVSDAVEYEKNSMITSYISGMNKAIKALPKEEQRNGRAYLLKNLNRWNYENTVTQEKMLGSLGDSAVNKDIIFEDLPGSELEWTVDKKKYVYQMTPQEYTKYINDYLTVIENARKQCGGNTVENYEIAKATAKDFMSNYKKKTLKERYLSKAVAK